MENAAPDTAIADTGAAPTTAEAFNGAAAAPPLAEAPPPTPVDPFGGLDEDTAAYVQNKGWASLDDVLTSYKNVEGMVGGRVKIPDTEDADGWNDLYTRLGRPEAPDAYELELPDDHTPEVVDWFKKAAHEAGLSQAQSGRIFGSYNEMVAGMQQQAQQQAEADSAAQMDALKREWGQAYEGKITAAKSAATRLGVEGEMVDKMASAVGLQETLKLFANMGEAIGEDSFASGDDRSQGSSAGMGLSPAQAQAQVNDLLADPNFSARYQRGEPAAVQRISNLYAQAG